MSSFFDGLYKILKDKFQFKAEVLDNVKEIRIGCDESVHITNNILFFPSIEKLDTDISNILLQETIPRALDPSQKQSYLALQQSQERLTELKSVENTTENKIGFFYGKIHPNDYNILKVAVLCDHLFLNGEKIRGEQLKREAIVRYGELARNIINLYSTGYFENTIKVLYEILRDSNDPEYEQKFKDIYRIIVNEAIFTLFINSNQSQEQALQKLKEKIQINKAYGAYKINIYGINSENVNKIERLLEDVKDEIEGEPYTIKNGQAIMVKLLLKKQGITENKRNDLVSII